MNDCFAFGNQQLQKNPKLSLYMTQQVLQLPLTAQRYAC